MADSDDPTYAPPSHEVDSLGPVAPQSPVAAQPPPTPAAKPPEAWEDQPPTVRDVVEFTIILLLIATLLRSFVAEAYLVPSGSMAPTLLGHHRHVGCPVCGSQFDVGVDENDPWGGSAVCPNCGSSSLNLAEMPISTGDRLLVLQNLYNFRAPRRWETIVFQNPNEPQQAFVKRVVGLPGEQIQVIHGDVYINGQIVRKSPAEYEPMRLLVHDLSQVPHDPESTLQRWRAGDSKWSVTASGLRLPADTDPDPKPQVASYRHRLDEGFPSPVYDTSPYSRPRAAHQLEAVQDLEWEATLERFRSTAGSAQAGRLEIRLLHLQDYELSLQLTPAGMVTLRQNGYVARTTQLNRPLRQIRFGVVDQQVWVLLNGDKAFDPLPLDAHGPVLGRRSPEPAIEVEATGIECSLRDVKLWRDVYYTSSGSLSWRSNGIQEPFQLGADEYFMLGDNSAISNDSRAWKEAAVPGSLLVGKPVAVHLPSRTYEWTVWGRKVQLSLPDFGAMRRVR